MTVNGITLNQPSLGRTDNNSTKNGDSSNQGWKYLSVQVGDTIYTYIVIGKDMRILIGKTTTEDENKQNDKKSNGDNKPAENNNNSPVNTAGQTDNIQIEDKTVSFLSDWRMLGLTAFHQQKLRQMIKNMEDRIVYDNTEHLKSVKKLSDNKENN